MKKIIIIFLIPITYGQLITSMEKPPVCEKIVNAPASLRSQALQATAQLPADQILQKLPLLPVDVYYDLINAIIIKNKKITNQDIITIIKAMINKMPGGEDIFLSYLITALDGTSSQIDAKQAIEIKDFPLPDSPLITFAIIFKNKKLSMNEKEALINSGNLYKNRADTDLSLFFARYLLRNEDFLMYHPQRLYTQGINLINEPMQGGEPALSILQQAIYEMRYRGFNNTNVIHFLLESGADPNRSNPGGLSALASAAGGGLNTVVQDLITHGARLQPGTRPSYDPLYQAAFDNNEDTLKILLAAGANSNKFYYTHEFGYGTLLDFAQAILKDQSYGFPTKKQKTVELLKKYGAKTLDELRKTKKKTAQDIANNLIALAQANPEEIEGGTQPYFDPLYIAASMGDEEVLKLLLAQGRDINKKYHTWDWGQGTLLDQAIAIRDGDELAILKAHRDLAVELLKKYGAKTKEELTKEKP